MTITDITNYSDADLQDMILNQVANRATKKSIKESIEYFNSRRSNIKMELVTLEEVKVIGKRPRFDVPALKLSDGSCFTARTKKDAWFLLTYTIAEMEDFYPVDADDEEPIEETEDNTEDFLDWFING